MDKLDNRYLTAFNGGVMEAVDLMDLSKMKRGRVNFALLNENGEVQLIFRDLYKNTSGKTNEVNFEAMQEQSITIDLNNYIVQHIAPHAQGQGHRLQLLPKDPAGENILLHPANGVEFNTKPVMTD